MAGLALGWKRFRFWEEERAGVSTLPANVACSAPGAEAGCAWLGCSDGMVVCADLGAAAVRASFPAHQGRVHFLLSTKERLLSVGEEGEGGGAALTLKAWAAEGLQPGSSPQALASVRLFGGKPPEGSVTALAVHPADWPTLTVAVGLSTGAVYLLKGDTSKGKLAQPLPPLALRPKEAPPAPAAGSSAASAAVTGLHFAPGTAPAAAAPGAGSAKDGGSASELVLYAVGAARTAAFAARSGQRLLDDEAVGAAPGCSVLTPRGELAVAAPEAVHFLSAEEGRKASFAIRGEKLAVAAVRHYLVVATPEEGDTSSGAAGGRSGGLGHPVHVRVFDLANKVVAASATLDGPLAWLAAAPGGGLIAVANGEGVVRLRERPLGEKLEALYKARAFQLALAVAEVEKADAATLAAVRRRYGDFLYGKRDYDQALEQYAATIGELEPSYVIQRYLDAQRIGGLIAYLEALHTQGAARGDHTTLLLNCYTKSRDVAKLDAFIRRGGGGEGPPPGAGPSGSAGGALAAPPTFHFDVETAIKVCRSAGYTDHALYVAQAAGDPQTYLDILLEDCARFEDGLVFLRGLPRRQAAAGLARYGKPLLSSVPVETTALLMSLCMPPPPPGAQVQQQGRGSSAAAGASGAAAAAAEDSYVADLADFAHLYADRPDDLRYACITILNMSPEGPSTPTLYHTLLDLYLGGTGATNPATTIGSTHGTSASAAFNAEASAAPTAAAAAAPSSIQQGGGAPAPAASSSARRDALDLLRRGLTPGEPPRYDVDRALVTCRLHAFTEGLVFLYESQRLYREAAAALMEAGDWEGLLGACDRHGNAASGGDPQLWHDTLQYFARQTDRDCTQQVQALLARIEAGALLPPLVVLQALARNPRLTLDIVKGYVTRQLGGEAAATRADLEEGEALRAEAERTRAQVDHLRTEPVVFQSSRDSQTGGPLELPSVHFLCGHSFNLRTLGDGEGAACPLCAPAHRKTEDLRRSNRASAADKDAFFRQLRTAGDGFGLVAEYFGKGILNNTSVTTAAAAGLG